MLYVALSLQPLCECVYVLQVCDDKLKEEPLSWKPTKEAGVVPQ